MRVDCVSPTPVGLTRLARSCAAAGWAPGDAGAAVGVSPWLLWAWQVRPLSVVDAGALEGLWRAAEWCDANPRPGSDHAAMAAAKGWYRLGMFDDVHDPGPLDVHGACDCGWPDGITARQPTRTDASAGQHAPHCRGWGWGVLRAREYGTWADFSAERLGGLAHLSAVRVRRVEDGALPFLAGFDGLGPDSWWGPGRRRAMRAETAPTPVGLTRLARSCTAAGWAPDDVAAVAGVDPSTVLAWQAQPPAALPSGVADVLTAAAGMCDTDPRPGTDWAVMAAAKGWYRLGEWGDIHAPEPLDVPGVCDCGLDMISALQWRVSVKDGRRAQAHERHCRGWGWGVLRAREYGTWADFSNSALAGLEAFGRAGARCRHIEAGRIPFLKEHDGLGPAEWWGPRKGKR